MLSGLMRYISPKVLPVGPDGVIPSSIQEGNEAMFDTLSDYASNPNIGTSNDSIIQVMRMSNDSISLVSHFHDFLPKISIESISYDSLFQKELTRRISQSRTKRVHILYFGDSQIESDHITSTLRHILQAKYGGKGAGFLPVKDIYNSMEGFIVEKSSGWTNSRIYDKNNSDPFSPLANYSKVQMSNASLLVNQISGTHKTSLSNLEVYYSAEDNKSEIKIATSGNNYQEVTLPSSQEPRIQNIKLNGTPSSLKLLFLPGKNMKIHGVFLGSGPGVYVDNISLRGQIIPHLQKVPKLYLSNFMKENNVGLIVLQFGVNLVPGMLKSYRFYTRMLKKQIELIRAADPRVPILVVGVSDMAKRSGTSLESYPNLQDVKKAQAEVAKEAGIAFWDLEREMGGKNSMIRWVGSCPSLGTKDYIHFNRLGADSVGRMLSKALLIPLNKKKD
ncbi:MAG: hypothetical protein Q8862_01155 [Bacteroidota bacterium]|nr:hypothetical protein [Bacteroidota bacterium]MDP4204637.1 hypothetical protein [Bacteroidota bacterium]